MNIINATPPADFPEQVIVAQDQEFAHRHPEAAYWLRVAEGGAVQGIPLPGAVGPWHACRIAQGLGYAPTHYTDPGSGLAWRL